MADKVEQFNSLHRQGLQVISQAISLVRLVRGLVRCHRCHLAVLEGHFPAGPGARHSVHPRPMVSPPLFFPVKYPSPRI